MFAVRVEVFRDGDIETAVRSFQKSELHHTHYYSIIIGKEIIKFVGNIFVTCEDVFCKLF